MISVLREFFDVTNELVLFLYGLVFFVLGLAIALQSRSHSRLELARSLGWFSVFGLSHGLHEWGQLFIPLQARYMRDSGVALLQVIETMLLGLSFGALFQFGAELLRDRRPWLPWLPLPLVTLWLLWLLLYGLGASPALGQWQQNGSIWARYLIGFPGALLAAWGLRHQAERQIRPLGLTTIYNTLRVAGFALGAYSVLAGLFVPAGDFFPANWINQSALSVYLGLPAPVLRSVAGLVIVVTIIRAMEVFDLEIARQIEKMEVDQKLAEERERIGRELHDGAIQRAYTAGLIIESARRRVAADDVVAQRLDKALSVLDEAIAGLRTYMSDMRVEPSAVSLAEGLRQQAGDPRFTTLMNVDLRLALPGGPAFNAVQTSHVLAIAGEALANAARHGQARHVTVDAGRQDGAFVLTIADDGRGFAGASEGNGYGLRNMRDRARLLGGTLTVESTPGAGTRVRLVAPWEER
jgi:signal transduction histidine kinase